MFKKRGCDLRLLCYSFAVMCSISEVWEKVVHYVRRTDEWYRWVLTAISKKCFHKQIGRGKKNPYAKWKTPDELTSMLYPNGGVHGFDPEQICSVFGNIDGIKHCEISLLDAEGEENVPDVLFVYQDVNEVECVSLNEYIGFGSDGRFWEL